jgi:murein DD-endopeptidase MepM/ murein hydrolase activator NlpD
VVTRPTVTVTGGGFGVQRLTLPDQMVDLDDATLVRVAREKAAVGTLWEQGAKSAPVWSDDWRLPVAGKAAGSFGKRRIINGNPRSPHNGEDIPAAAGTPVLAPNAGTVRLAGERFFGGQTVFLEHGGGLFTFYMHLSAVDVVDGQRVRAGDQIGRVGASGRATGPHLHWGGRLNNARINPFTLLQPAALTVAAAPAADQVGTPAADQVGTPVADQVGTPVADQVGTP